MDSFHTCATQMLKEFRALLHISPIPINSHRILQLLSLNMYAIDCNALKCTELKGESRTILCSITDEKIFFVIVVVIVVIFLQYA